MALQPQKYRLQCLRILLWQVCVCMAPALWEGKGRLTGQSIVFAGLHQRHEPGLPGPDHIWILRSGCSAHSSLHPPELWSPINPHHTLLRTQALREAVQEVRPQRVHARAPAAERAQQHLPGSAERAYTGCAAGVSETGPSLAISCRTSRQAGRRARTVSPPVEVRCM